MNVNIQHLKQEVDCTNSEKLGVTNGVAYFQRVIDTQENLVEVYAYLDDITICGNNQTEHDLNLNKFHTIIKKYRLILNEDKCKFS